MENLAPGVMQFSVDSDCPNFNLLSNQEIIGKLLVIKEPLPLSFQQCTKGKSFSDAAIM